MLQLVGYGCVGCLDVAFVGGLLFAFPGLGFVFVFAGCLFGGLVWFCVCCFYLLVFGLLVVWCLGFG